MFIHMKAAYLIYRSKKEEFGEGIGASVPLTEKVKQ